MPKYHGYPDDLKIPFFKHEKHELELFMESVLVYVKKGTGSFQTNGQFYHIDRIEQLSFELQKKLAYQIKSFLADEAKMSLTKYVLSFFMKQPTDCIARADTILSHVDPKSIAIAERWLRDGETPTFPVQIIF